MGFRLLIPFLLIRFAMLPFLNKEAAKRASHFPLLRETEKVWYWVYQFSATAMYILPFFLKIRIAPPALFCCGIAAYSAGTVLLTIALINFAAPAESGINKNGLYRLSRNPIYVSYFVFFIGCVLLTQSPLLLGFLLALQISTHRIILAEEGWCVETFGDEYLDYMNSVRRYI